MYGLKAGALGAALVLLAACAQQPRNDTLPLDEHLAKLGYRQGEPVRSILGFDINGWEYLDKRHITLGSGPGRKYLIEFRQPCNNLGFGNQIGYSSTAGSLTRLDKVVSTDSSGFPEHCLIEDMYRLEKVEKPES
jgi:methenyltetrahydromethanopterin cyclohydrolase